MEGYFEIGSRGSKATVLGIHFGCGGATLSSTKSSHWEHGIASKDGTTPCNGSISSGILRDEGKALGDKREGEGGNLVGDLTQRSSSNRVPTRGLADS